MLRTGFSLLALLFLFSPTRAQTSLTQSGIVQEQGTGKPIPEAIVVVVGGKADQDTTDNSGKFSLKFPASVTPGTMLRIRVTKEGYETYDAKIAVSSELPLPILLKKLGKVKPSASTAPAPAVTNDAPGGFSISGGTVINPTINNYGAPERAVPADKESDFEAALKTFPAGGVITIVKGGSSDDIGPLQSQIIKLLKNAGWGASTADGITINGESPQAKGLECYSSTGWDEPMPLAFKSALRAGNLDCDYFPKTYSFYGVSFSGVTLVIGRTKSPLTQLPAQPPQSSVTVLDNQGTIDNATGGGGVTIKGVPPPNSNLTVIRNAPNSKIGTLTLPSQTEVDFIPMGPIPAPAEQVKIPKSRVLKLIADIQQWEGLKRSGEPNIVLPIQVPEATRREKEKPLRGVLASTDARVSHNFWRADSVHHFSITELQAECYWSALRARKSTARYP
jgi:hypothetical protein